MISDSLDLAPIEKEETEVVVQSDDYEYTRRNLYDLIEKAKEVLDDIIDIAHTSQHPRSFETVNQTLDVIAKINRDLIKLEIDRNKAKGTVVKPNVGDTPKNVTNNNLFVGSTNELQQMLEQMKKS